MDVPSSLVATASVVALLLVVGWTARRSAPDDQRDLRQALLGAVCLILTVAVIAIAWTLTRP